MKIPIKNQTTGRVVFIATLSSSALDHNELTRHFQNPLVAAKLANAARCTPDEARMRETHLKQATEALGKLLDLTVSHILKIEEAAETVSIPL
jgi:hypothetical protein